MNIKILVAYHKRSVLINDDIFLPIHVGKISSKDELGIIGDDTGDNISNKNQIYSEMTAAYWGWKNLRTDYIGLCHYRRILTFESQSLFESFVRGAYYYISKIICLFKPGHLVIRHHNVKVNKEELFLNAAHAFTSELKCKMKNKEYDLVVPRPIELSTINVRRFFDIGLYPRQLMDRIVKELSPSFYPYYKKALETNKLYAANIFIMRSSLYDEYCQTVFPILLEHERRSQQEGWCNNVLNEGCYSRMSGYFAEFLTSAFIYKMCHENRKILYTNVEYLV